ncbi:hypothetical protein BpHYR1_009004 [Brachionus plicatilis]|uniref:Uncharacterized protein n=1 Tax=Brachionus plicatilis TaxID=10195 RepID=A0A3M7QDD6_BRAPC|nr:hypothetical protein BpHYR1_009004 [Brachionus plicatilis]
MYSEKQFNVPSLVQNEAYTRNSFFNVNSTLDKSNLSFSENNSYEEEFENVSMYSEKQFNVPSLVQNEAYTRNSFFNINSTLDKNVF